MQDVEQHWTGVYDQKAPTEVSWYQAKPESSLRALERFGCQPSDAFIDIGGGASNLVDALVSRGWADVTVLDIAASAIKVTQARLGNDAGKVHWEIADITDWQPSRRYYVWHDRAVFHFLTGPDQRDAYRRALLKAVPRDGLVLMATFALDGPERCSGLTVRRYDPEMLAKELGPSMQLLDSWREEHTTPFGAKQSFNWCALRHEN